MSASRKGKAFLHFFTSFLSLGLISNCSSEIETKITPTHYINDQQTVTSSGEIFKLGFFSPINSTNRYVGIWYNKIPGEKTIVWVANRDKPVNDSSGVLRIAQDGNLVVLDGRGTVLWTTNVSRDHIPVNISTTAELLDSGNLVLRSDNTSSSSSSSSIWESFENPSNTYLPEMKIGVNRETGKNYFLTSWKSHSDPSNGDMTAGLEVIDIPQVVIWNGTQRYWRSGPWNKRIFIGLPTMYSVYSDGFDIERGVGEDTIYMTYTFPIKTSYSRFNLSQSGELLGLRWDTGGNGWYADFTNTDNGECDVYNKCGPFGSCHILDSPICSCLRGFSPKFKDEWSKGNWSGGCLRNTELQCKRNKTTSIGDENEKDGFWKMELMKVPDFAYGLAGSRDIKNCEQECFKNCSCLAYTYDNGAGCLTWGGNLIDMQKFPRGGVDLFIRLAHLDLIDVKKNSPKVIIITTVVLATLIICACTYFCWSWRVNRREKQMEDMEISVNIDNTDLKLFKFEQLAIATNNFSEANKLGEGGFGPVYKGKLEVDGREIAVKRLSQRSSQGIEEFKNEILVILKLQHRNLVRLLGCCIEGDEKMLIYEYMPNKSLDALLFDIAKRAILDWKKRFQIIEGISRGILYLHRDSIVRVIHRDLKASNILLDEELNPKISDFGMARIFRGNELQANTKRVVGTYGYMSPEYAMEGRFSEKSDVFSFGVLLLEIVTRKRNTDLYNDEWLSLLGYAWQLWNEDKLQLLIDQTLLSESIYEVEIVRCIQVGLLCVQEFAKDRPTMSTTLSMLTSEITVLPTPKQPAFIGTKDSPYSSSNKVTFTSVEGR